MAMAVLRVSRVSLHMHHRASIVDRSLMARRLYTRAQDTLDPEDLIFPRAATRVGVKYQANVLSWEEQQAAEAYHGAHHGFVEGEAGPSRHITSAHTPFTQA
jgi:hypothetical protein